MEKIIFLKNCKLSGVDGLIIVDLPWPENKDFSQKCKRKKNNLRSITFTHNFHRKNEKNY